MSEDVAKVGKFQGGVLAPGRRDVIRGGVREGNTRRVHARHQLHPVDQEARGREGGHTEVMTSFRVTSHAD